MGTATKGSKKAATKKGTAVAKTEAPQLPAEMLEEMQADASQGLEMAGRDDFAIPFIGLLQKMSPQIDKDDDQYIEDAEAGMLFNTVTREIFDGEEGILVIPCHFEKVYNEFVPRATGGGWRGSYATQEEAQEAVTEGNEIIDTANHYILYSPDNGETWTPALLSMTSTKLKVSRQWNAKMRMVNVPGKDGKKFIPATFAQIWAITSVGQENAKGKFHNFSTEMTGLVEDPAVYALAKGMRAAVTAGRGRVDYDAGESDEGRSAVADGGEF